METFKVDLNLDYESLNLGEGHRAFMNCLLPSNFNEYSKGRKRPAIVVIPGGGYGMLSEREAEPIALQFIAEDMAAFIVQYSVSEDAAFPRCLFEALTAIKTIRENADDWNIDTDKIAVIGFSAGGHLAASVGAFWNHDFVKEALGSNEMVKPNAAILSYPVITSGPMAHRGSFNNLVGKDADQEILDLVSIEKQVTANYPPTFLWHTATDEVVPVKNSIMMADALDNAKVPFELHIFPTGVHGLALCDERTTGKDQNGNYKTKYMENRPIIWVEESIKFLRETAFQ